MPSLQTSYLVHHNTTLASSPAGYRVSFRFSPLLGAFSLYGLRRLCALRASGASERFGASSRPSRSSLFPCVASCRIRSCSRLRDSLLAPAVLGARLDTALLFVHQCGPLRYRLRPSLTCLSGSIHFSLPQCFLAVFQLLFFLFSSLISWSST